MALRGDDYAEDIGFSDLYELARGAQGRDKYGYRSEFLGLIKIANNITE